MDVAASDPTLELRMCQVIQKCDTPDAFILAATGKPGGNDFRIDEMYWWVDFEYDSERPKGERTNEERPVRAINLWLI